MPTRPEGFPPPPPPMPLARHPSSRSAMYAPWPAIAAIVVLGVLVTGPSARAAERYLARAVGPAAA